MPYIKIAFVVFMLLIVSLSSCQKENRCKLQPEIGEGRANFTKYYFDHSTKKCKAFIWGGSGGVVSFETKEECELCGCQ